MSKLLIENAIVIIGDAKAGAITGDEAADRLEANLASEVKAA